jgi:hypothetical protein
LVGIKDFPQHPHTGALTDYDSAWGAIARAQNDEDAEAAADKWLKKERSRFENAGSG